MKGSQSSCVDSRIVEMYLSCLTDVLCPVDTVWVLSACFMSNTLWVIVRLCKVKYTLVQALTLCTGRTAHGGSRGIALLFLDRDTRRC